MVYLIEKDARTSMPRKLAKRAKKKKKMKDKNKAWEFYDKTHKPKKFKSDALRKKLREKHTNKRKAGDISYLGK